MKLDSRAVTTPDNEPMDVLQKDSPIDPSANLTRMSQFASAYATMTINKETEMQMLLKEKEDKILSLEQQLQKQSLTSKQRYSQLSYNKSSSR